MSMDATRSPMPVTTFFTALPNVLSFASGALAYLYCANDDGLTASSAKQLTNDWSGSRGCHECWTDLRKLSFRAVDTYFLQGGCG